jgi:hypothetical protein
MSASGHPWFRMHPVHHLNIVWHWDHATASELHRGLHWYANAHYVATAIAGGDAHLGAGMLAVYSPQQAWVANLLLAAQVLHTRVGIGGAGNGVFASTAQKQAADRLLAGERYDQVLSGPKVRAFAHLIEHGGNQTPDRSHVVIDRHALSVAHGNPLTIAQYGAAPLRAVKRRDGSIRHPHYDLLVELYHQAAVEISHRQGERVAAYQVQAVTWLVRQRLSQTAERARGMSRLEKGRERARLNTETAWRHFRAAHLPHLADVPDTGYQPAA